MPLYHFVPLRPDRRSGDPNRCLFSKYSLSASLVQQEGQFRQEIDTFTPEYLSVVSTEDVLSYLHEKYLIAVPVLLEEQINISDAPGKLDVSQNRNRAIRDRSKPYFIDGVSVTFHLPIDGQPELFDCAPDIVYFGEGPPEARIHKNELRFVYTVEQLSPAIVQRSFDEDLRYLHRVFHDLTGQLQSWNHGAKVAMTTRMEERVKRINIMRSEFRYPIRMRNDAPATPIVRRKILPPRAQGEPHLALQQYEEILTALQNAAVTFERAPSAFATMKEEDIRQQLLIILNGMFEGNAGAEIFNGAGKTDILIRAEGKTIFIAECKFWKGERSLAKALDQLLSYTSWRDTKTAVIILNRGGNLTNILRRIPNVVKKHPSFVREEPYGSESGSRYVLRNVHDPERELLMTVMAFDVPSPAP
jgi:hypothetical protein